MGLLGRVWLPLVIVVVVAIAGFTVNRVRGFFGSEPVMVAPDTVATESTSLDPKTITYEVFGPPGSVADINYLDPDIEAQGVEDAALPWELTLSTTAPSAVANVVAQGNSTSIGCRIIIDGKVKDEKVSNGVNSQTFCLVKSA
ncbi:MAG: MmpS family protein [Actinomycetia bacterium]|nr:MmpS family protein [Actinomycetes bacterium]